MNSQRPLLVFALSAAIAGLSACATSLPWADPADYSLRIVDKPTQKRFDLVLTAQGEKALCLVQEQWPSRGGQLHMGGDASVSSKGVVLPARKENFGYCPGGCGEYRITPSAPLQGFIAYEAFGDAQALALDPDKQLAFKVVPYVCGIR